MCCKASRSPEVITRGKLFSGDGTEDRGDHPKPTTLKAPSVVNEVSQTERPKTRTTVREGSTDTGTGRKHPRRQLLGHTGFLVVP